MTDNDKSSASDAPEPLSPASPDAVVVPASEQPSPVKSTAEQAPRPSRKAGLGVILLLLLFLSAAGLAGWFWQQLQQQSAQVRDVQTQVAQNSSRLAGLQARLQEEVGGQLADVQARSESREQEWRQQMASLQSEQVQLRQRLDGQQQRLASLSTTSREDWLLAEAEYLLNIANQRVLMEGTVDNAVSLLRSADERLQQVGDGTGDAEVFAIRKVLNLDLAALEKVEPVDKEGIYLRLHALAESVENLPRLQIEAFAVESATPIFETEASGTVGWMDRIWRALRDLTGSLDRYVRIDDVEAPAKPLVDSYATRLAALNVRLLLEQAQLALLQGEQTVYRHSLEQAQALLQNYYVNSEQNKRLRAALAELTAVDIAPELPDISASLARLRDYLRQLHRVQPAPKGQL